MMALQMASVALRNLTSKTLIIMDEFAKSVNKVSLTPRNYYGKMS